MRLDYRNFRSRDLKAFSALVGHAFKDDGYTTNRLIGSCLMRHELLGYLKRANYARVVCAQGARSGAEEPVGIFVAGIGACRMSPAVWLRSVLYALPLQFSAAGRRYLAYRRGLRTTDMRLLNCKHLNTELKLFVVRQEFQNEGIGRKLLEDFEATCRARGVKRFFLFTDSYCNVSYYIERGFTQQAEKTYNFFHESPPTHYYLFTYDI